MYEDKNGIRLMIHNSVKDGQEESMTDASAYLQNVLSRLSSLGYHDTKISVNIEIAEDIGVGASKVDVDSNDFDRFTNYEYYQGDMKSILQVINACSRFKMRGSDLVKLVEHIKSLIESIGIIIPECKNDALKSLDKMNMHTNFMWGRINRLFETLYIPYKVFPVDMSYKPVDPDDREYYISYWPEYSKSYIPLSLIHI